MTLKVAALTSVIALCCVDIINLLTVAIGTRCSFYLRDDVFSLDFSDGFTLSCQELNSIVLFLATDRQT